ncbi:MAG: glycine zipper family protein [Planctomycetes bacterium]|nr:glycine zipper family protein [Planctomycetota bacterium]
MARTQPSTQFPLRHVALVCLLGLSALLSGCNDAQAGALLGAGVGALAGQAIGRDTEATLIGTAVGAGAGYIIGNESDKAKHEREHYDGNYDY